MRPLVCVGLVVHNAAHTIVPALKSVLSQEGCDIEVRVIDNASTDQLQQLVRAQFPSVGLLRNAHRVGYGHGLNQLMAIGRRIQERSGRPVYWLLTSEQVTFAPGALRVLVDQLDRDTQLGACGPVVRRLFEEHADNEQLHERIQSDHIHTAGLRMLSSGQLEDLGSGELEVLDHPYPVFGVRLYAGLFRQQALEDTARDGEVFDTGYEGDDLEADLFWRFERTGWKTEVVPQASAYKACGRFKENVSLGKPLALRSLLTYGSWRTILQALVTRPWSIVLVLSNNLAPWRWYRLIARVHQERTRWRA